MKKKKNTLFVLEVVTLIFISVLLGSFTIVAIINMAWNKWYAQYLFSGQSIVYGLTDIFIVPAFVILVVSVFIRRSKMKAYCILKYILIANLCVLVILSFTSMVLTGISVSEEEGWDSDYNSIANYIIGSILFGFVPIAISLILNIILVAKIKKIEKYSDLILLDTEMAGGA